MTESNNRVQPNVIFSHNKGHFQVPIKPISGFCLEAKKEGEMVQILQKAFLTASNGEIFHRALEEISGIFLAKWLIENKLTETNISNCLIFLDEKNEADIFINTPTTMQIIAKGSIDAGNPVTKEDIADIRRIEFPEIDIESYCGIFYIFSMGWKRGLYFDLTSVEELEAKKDFKKLGTLFATFYSYITFPEILSLQEKVKDKMMEHGWFPFIRILGKRFKELQEAVKNDFPIMDTSLKIADSFDDDFIRKMCDTWMSKKEFRVHETIIRKGVERYLEEDYISSIHILYPRIEGIMRLMCGLDIRNLNSKDLVNKLESIAKEKDGLNLYLPEDFSRYLIKFFFAHFDIKEENVPLSRHSLAHGVANAGDFDKIKAFQSIMIIDQIFFYV